ncbi:MAG: DUF362 domain-containing protein [Deltaproteobacteria bacterium]
MEQESQKHAGAAMTTVIIRRADYRYDQIRPLVFEMIEKLAGEKITPGSRVLIKPNMLSAARIEDAVLTHPLIIKAAVEYVLQKGARPQVSDSPAIGSFDKIMKENGTTEALAGLDVLCRPFKDVLSVDIGKPYGRIEMARDALEADVIINLPKLKTHSQMLLTLAVKNMFGCIIGFNKSQWHMRAGIDVMAFARLLVAIHQAVAPAVSILDGILALEGEGPGKGGTPRPVGVLAGSDDSFALDMVICEMVGVSCENVPMLKVACSDRLIPSFDMDGDIPEVAGFRLPGGGPLVFGPPVLQNFLRRHTLSSPVCDPSLCRMCGQCWTICPAGAIREKTESIGFDYGKCIRCFCCVEVCPDGALSARETLGSKITKKMIDAFS